MTYAPKLFYRTIRIGIRRQNNRLKYIIKELGINFNKYLHPIPKRELAFTYLNSTLCSTPVKDGHPKAMNLKQFYLR